MEIYCAPSVYIEEQESKSTSPKTKMKEFYPTTKGEVDTLCEAMIRAIRSGRKVVISIEPEKNLSESPRFNEPVEIP